MQPYQQYPQYPAQQPYQQQPYGGYGAYGSYGPQTFGGQQPYPMYEPESRRRGPLTALLVVGVIVLLIVMAGGGALLVSRLHLSTANATSTATATATVPAGFKSYTDPGGNFRLVVPADWSTQTPQTSQSLHQTVFASPDNTALLTVASYDATFDQSSFGASEKAIFTGMSTGGGGPGTYSHLQGPTTVSLGGENWSQVSADVLLQHGITLHTVVLLANHAGHAYFIAYAAKPANFNNLNAKDFQTMTHSFAFSK